MKTSVLNCPNCKANIKIATKKQEYLFCPYCGSQVFLDGEKGEYTYNYNYTKRTINDAEVIRAKTEEKKARYEHRSGWYWVIGFIIFCAGIFLYEYYSDIQEQKAADIAKSEGMISAGDYYDYEEKNYLSVQKQLESAGFTNIELVDLNDASWFSKTKKKDTVENVSINGSSEFHDSDYFEKDAKVVITYH